jgi:hypothetical protein
MCLLCYMTIDAAAAGWQYTISVLSPGVDTDKAGGNIKGLTYNTKSP